VSPSPLCAAGLGLGAGDTAVAATAGCSPKRATAVIYPRKLLPSKRAVERRSNDSALRTGSLQLVRSGADGRASGHYRFDAEQMRRARLSWLLSFLKGRSAELDLRLSCFDPIACKESASTSACADSLPARKGGPLPRGARCVC
jgi:hypothetical protein